MKKILFLGHTNFHVYNHIAKIISNKFDVSAVYNYQLEEDISPYNKIYFTTKKRSKFYFIHLLSC